MRDDYVQTIEYTPEMIERMKELFAKYPPMRAPAAGDSCLSNFPRAEQ